VSGQPRPGFLQPVGGYVAKVHPLGNQTQQCEIHYKGRFTSLGISSMVDSPALLTPVRLLLCPFSFQLSPCVFSGQEQRWLSESDVRVGVRWRRESQNDARMLVGWSPAQVHGKMVAWSKLGWLVVWNIFIRLSIFFGNVIIPTDELHDFSEG